jgi:predicted adenylyl cyclase CyaB
MQNIEIKARVKDHKAIEKLLKSASAEKVEKLIQKDTYFNSENSRLKLREINDKKFVLIQYDRADQKKAKVSEYSIYETKAPDKLKSCLIKSLGIKTIIEKVRVLYQIKNTRIHLDKVKDLGSFIELETVVKDASQMEKLRTENQEIREFLKIKSKDLVERSYSDILLEKEKLVGRQKENPPGSSGRIP